MIDLSHLRCPMPFVRIRIALEAAEPGTELRFLLGDADSARQLPASLSELGHELLTLEETSRSLWTATIKA